MKQFAIAALVILLGCANAQCRIGESLQELTTRFGAGKKNSGKMRMPGHDQYYFEKDNIGIQCVMTNDKCVLEVFHRLGSTITDQDIKELLKSEGETHSWREDKKTKRWIRGDNKVVAYREPRHEDMFFVEDMAVKKEGEKASKGKQGF